MALVVDASVGLKWVLEEPDSAWAEALGRMEPDLLVPDFWLHEAANVLWVQVRRRVLAPDEARSALAILRDVIEPTPTAGLSLHEAALEMSLAADHSTYDTLYLAFALAMGARGVVVADAPFVRHMRALPELGHLVISLAEWAEAAGLAGA